MPPPDPFAFDLDTALTHLQSADATLAAVIDRVGAVEIETRGEPYAELVRAVLYQQLAGAAAATIERRFRALFEDRVPRPEELLAVPEEQLRGAGVSRQKIGYLRDLAARATDGTVSDELHTLPDEHVIARVTAVKGIGRWTADMLLLFCLGRPDVLPVVDLGIRKGMQRVYALPDLPAPTDMERIAAPWRPYRSLGARYLWRALDTGTL